MNGFVGVCMAAQFLVKLNRLRNGERGEQPVRGLVGSPGEGARTSMVSFRG